MLKKLSLGLFLTVLFFAAPGASYGQNLARVCVVDMAKIYQESSQSSRAARDYETRFQNVQNEIDRRANAINELKVRHSTAVANNNQNEANRLENQINAQTQALQEYYEAQTAILERQLATLMQSGSFLNQVMDEIRLVAEGEGFSIVIDRSNRNSGVVWSSSTVDITEKVIQSIQSKSR